MAASPARICPSHEVPCDRSTGPRSEEHTSELQSLRHLVCRLLLEKKKTLPAARHRPNAYRCRDSRWRWRSARHQFVGLTYFSTKRYPSFIMLAGMPSVIFLILFFVVHRPQQSTLLPYTTLFRSSR